MKPNKSEHQRIGEKGIPLHSFYTSKLDHVYQLIMNYQELIYTKIQENEFSKRLFVFSDTAGISWQIIEKNKTP